MTQRPAASSLFAHLEKDVPAALVVFLVALPLCLGIALASGAPPISGVIAGVVGGVLVGSISGSPLGVSGPAAGLAVIVLTAIQSLGSYELFLTSVVIAGVLQLALGLLRAGVLAYYFPSAVINGMLAGIGLIIILKQIPHAVGYNLDFEGDEAFLQPDHENSLSALSSMLDFLSEGSIVIAAVCIGVMLFWDTPRIKKSRLGAIPGPLLAVVLGIALGRAFDGNRILGLGASFYVNLPDVTLSNLSEALHAPALGGFLQPVVWKTGAVMAIVASLETLLCVEATDKLDPERRVTPTNRELFAQGAGNVVSGLVGGLPITQVIVRSSANIQSGGRTKLSTILHGALLLLALLLIPGLLRLIPLASLAAILLLVGYKLANPKLFVKMWKKGFYQNFPFLVTVAGVVFTDLLTGVLIGMGVGVFSILYNNYRVPFHFDLGSWVPGEPVRIRLSEDVSFLNKASIQRTLAELPRGAHVILDASGTMGLDPDVKEIIIDAAHRAPREGVKLELEGFESDDRRERSGLQQFQQELRDATARSGDLAKVPGLSMDRTSASR